MRLLSLGKYKRSNVWKRSGSLFLLQIRTKSYSECVTAEKFLNIMTEAEFFLCAVVQGLDFVVTDDEVTVGSQQVVCHQIGVV